MLPHNPRNVLESNDNDNEASNFLATSWETSQDVNVNDDDEDVVEVVEQPVESAEAKLS